MRCDEVQAPIFPCYESRVQREQVPNAERQRNEGMPSLTDKKAELHFSADGYLRMSREVAAEFFPSDSLLVLFNADQICLLPTRGPAAGGLMLKQRNPQGDRSVLVSESLHFQRIDGDFEAIWDEKIGGLRLDLSQPMNLLPPSHGPISANARIEEKDDASCSN